MPTVEEREEIKIHLKKTDKQNFDIKTSKASKGFWCRIEEVIKEALFRLMMKKEVTDEHILAAIEKHSLSMNDAKQLTRCVCGQKPGRTSINKRTKTLMTTAKMFLIETRILQSFYLTCSSIFHLLKDLYTF